MGVGKAAGGPIGVPTGAVSDGAATVVGVDGRAAASDGATGAAAGGGAETGVG